MPTLKTRLKQVVDWRAALIAGAVSGTVFLLLTMWLTYSEVGSAWLMPRLLASALLGADILTPTAGDGVKVWGAAILVHLPLSLGFACLIAYVLHRWGLLVGIGGGALFGLVLYGINFYALTAWLPQFVIIKSVSVAFAHLMFGAFAGGVYELLEVEEFVAVPE
ncbi:MAG: hypothetical protein MUF71_09480 [Candidatus Kapabacteria bacterium]|jgi:hypothetical protein|nr:hypothetical protein [Candidatus Kapabacteria bacterium]